MKYYQKLRKQKFVEAFTGTSRGTTVLMVIKDHKRDTIPQLPQEQEIN